MQRNYIHDEYPEYQPVRKYGPQYEPGGFASLVQQRSNMTQREDALKFEQGRIKALQEERLHIQKKTFTKWMNSFLQKARMEVDDLFVDLADGRRLLRLLEIISGERLARPNTGRMRVHKIENVNKSLAFLHTKVRLESIGAEDIVDGNPRLILGLIWTIILRFQIQEIEIDVDEENESSEKKSAKDALLLWCQRKTNGYHGVHIHNFTDSWRSGLGFNALIHAHRPDLFRWNELPKKTHIDNLNHAFDVADNHLGIPKLLDAEDVDTSRPDEKSVMTYVASYYHTFARMKNEQKSGRRIANIIGQLMMVDSRKAEYAHLLTTLLEWIRLKMEELNSRELPNSLDGIQRLLLAFKQYRTVEKPPKYKERSEIEALYFDINTMQKSLTGEPWSPPEGMLPQELERAWQQLEHAEHAREIALRTELLRQQRLEQLNYKFNTKSVLRKGYLKEMIQVLSDPRYGSNLAQVDATVKKHEAISADILARTERFEDLSAMAAELVRENYHGAENVTRTEQLVLTRWRELLALLNEHRESLLRLSQLMSLVREADTTLATVEEMHTQFSSEEVGPHLAGVERLAQAHALRELQLGALDESIRRLVRQGTQAQGPPAPLQALSNKLRQLENAYDSLLAAAKDRKARLQDARTLYQFLEDHDEEEGWLTDRQRICQTGVAAKDLRAVLALQQKHAALVQELRAREPVTARVLNKGKSLLEAKHPKSSEIEKRLASLARQWEVLRELAAAREKQLADAAEAYQFYADANEAESWMKEKRALAASSDVGSDAPAASALLARQKALHEEISAYKPEVDALEAQSNKLTAAGIDSLQLPTEVESAPEEEEMFKETRLVPTEVWEEEPVERLEHRTVTEERSVPQVKALYAFTGQGISIQKGDVMFLINKTNPDWWSVRKADRTDGFVPANYVREMEPRIVPVQVRRPEKVRSVQRVKKTVLVKQVVSVARPATARRASRAHATSAPTDTVHGRMTRIKDNYEELLQLSTGRRQQLEDAIQLYDFFAECDDFDKWIRDKEKLLRSDDDAEGVENAKRKYEKLVTDLSAASKRLERVDASADVLASTRRSQAAKVTQRQQQLHQAWDKLVRLKEAKEKSLEGASSVELFSRTCDEARDWMGEKAQQLEVTAAPASDLRTVQALQRRHAQLERELEPLKEKVNTVNLLADSVKSQYPTEQAHVERRRGEIQEMWLRCQAQAAERRARLENAVGHQIFQHSSAALDDWLQKVRSALAAESVAKDVATAEALHKEHQELRDDIRAHADEFKEVVGLGEKLVAHNPALTDVAERVAALRRDHDAVVREWAEKEEQLRQLVQLQTFNREADQMDASSGAHEAFLNHTQRGSSVDEAEALLKRHEEFEARLTAQDERLRAFVNTAEKLAAAPHYASDHIRARVQQVKTRRAAVRAAASERRRALQATLAYQQFLAAADDLDVWIQDKMRTATDQNYRDLSNLERKLQKHEAYERELNANEKQLRNVDSVGQSLMAADAGRADEVSERLRKLHRAWEGLVAASRDKGGKLRQAAAQRTHRRSAEDAKARLLELERSLLSEETGADLRSCKRLLNQHQVLETELLSMEQRSGELAAAGRDLVAEGHFDAETIEKDSAQLLTASAALREPSRARRAKLEEGLRFHKFATEIGNELQWISERLPAASSDASPADLHSAQHAHKKHAKLREEIAGHRPVVDKVLKQGEQLTEQSHPDEEKVKALSASLQESYAQLVSAADARAQRLETALKAQQFLHDALEVDSWLADKATALASTDYGRDRHHAMQLLTRHKALELELDTYAAIVAEMGHAANSMASAQHPDAPALLKRHKALTQSLQRLQRLAAQRQKALVESMCRHEYVVESAELEQWIQEQYTAASSEDYGQDYEHLLLLRSKFDELRHRVETGSERFAQCEELAKKLVASESPYIPDIEKRQEALGESWQKLVDQIASRGARLAAAGEIHRFHRDVADALARMADKRAQLDAQDAPRDYNAALALLRRHETIENDLVALDAQLQVLQEDAARLQELYPGGNVAQILRQQRALAEAWAGLRAAAAERRDRLLAAVDLHRFFTQVRDLTSWSSGLRASMAGEPRVRDASAAQALRAEHDAIKGEIEAREDSFRSTLELGQAMVQTGHRSAQEVEEKCAGLLEERGRLHGAWQARQVALDQLIDLHFFLRDAKQLHSLCAAQEAALGTEISPTSSVEEVDNQLKKHEAFAKLLTTQDEKLSTLNSHGAKLLQQNHVESQRIADELEKVNQRRKKVHELSTARRAQLVQALLRAQFVRDAAEVRTWIAGKMKKLEADQGQGEVTSLEDKIKKLQKHQAFRAEIAANEERVAEVARTASELGATGDVRDTLAALQSEWKSLLLATEERGRGLEEAQDMLEFNQNLDKIEAWIRDKEMMVQAHELGRDYEHCHALLRKLDDVDSDMRVDDKHIKSICALADKLLNQGPTQQSRAVEQRRDAFLSKWRALSGALQSYRDHLGAALEIHAFNRDVADTSERMAEKAALFSSTETGRQLAAAQELRRKHEALATEATAIGDKIRGHGKEGARLANKYPDHATEIEGRLKELTEAWQRLLQLADKRSKLLDDATTVHKFDENLKALEVWVEESVKRMNTAEPPASVSEAEALLELHQERKAEIDGRQKTVSELQQKATALTELEDSPERVQRKVDKLQQLSASLHDAWKERKSYLTQAHQLQLLKEQARQTEDWLAEKEAFLNNDDLGESLAAVEILIRKHKDFEKLLESQRGRVAELERFADSISDGHYDRAYILRRVQAVTARTHKLQESCAVRGQRLQESRQLQQFLRDLYHEQEWIALKMQIANDQNYRDLSNLQSKIQKHAAFESELQVNKTRVDDVGNHGEQLIEAKHYASQEIAEHVAGLEREWRSLQEAARMRRERLAAAYQARVFLRGLDDFTLWLDEVESQLLSEDHGKDLASVSALLKRHARLEQQVSSRSETAQQLAETAHHLADQGHFMADEILEKSDAAVKRYRSLQEPVSVRRDNLEDAQHLHRWLRDADEELQWLREREPACRLDDTGSTLAHAQSLQKKHRALEAELLSREPIVSGLSARATDLARRGHFATAQLEARSQQLHETLKNLNELAAARRLKLQDAVELHQFNVEAAEIEVWLAERRPALVSSDVGRDEDSVVSLQRRLEAQQRETAVADATIVKLEKLASALQDRPTVDGAGVKARAEAVRAAYEDLKLLTAKRQQRLEQSLKYFKFVHECEEVQEWIGDQMGVAASEEYGLDVEHVETLQHAFDNFLASVNGNEGRIEGVAEAGEALLEERTPEAERVKRHVEDVRGLWEDLKELAIARQEALAGARQVHVFDRTADETVAWIAEKDSALGSEPSFGPQHDLDTIQALVRKHEALEADLEAVKQQVHQLSTEAERLGAAFPDAREHVTAKLEEVTEGLTTLLARAHESRDQLHRAEQLQTYFDSYQELMAWTSEALARTTAPELAHDVAGAELLMARHNDISAEIKARDDAFTHFYADGEKLVSEGHFLSSEISERVSALRARRRLLDETWQRRAELYARHLDALIFKRDADALDTWISAREPQLRDGQLGESVPHVEELIKKHDDFEKTIESQKEKFNALRRITLVEKAFRHQQDEEAAARKRSAEKQEADRLEQTRRREMQRIAEERRREDGVRAAVPHQPPVRESERMPAMQTSSTDDAPSEETPREQPAPLQPQSSFDKLNNVKRAESMNVVKTPKRTPSFTTRRRTQSFRRHQRGDPADLPPVEIKGYLERKQESGCGGKRATVRSWRPYYSVLCGQLLCFFRDEVDFVHAKAAAPPVAILNARCEPAGDYTKRKHVFRLACADGAEFLFGCSSRELMTDWVTKISFHAALPPQLQLTPYAPDAGEDSPTAEVRRKLQRNDSMSSSGGSSPEPERRHRTQAEILQEHRNSQQQLSQKRQTSPPHTDRLIESAVLPSLPPRHASEEPADIAMRNSEVPASSWGSTRFSNGRDPNADFIRSQQLDNAPPLPHTAPPGPDRAPAIPERVPNVHDRVLYMPERGPPHMPERVPLGRGQNEKSLHQRGQHITERGQHISERGQHISERGQQFSERGQQFSERGQNIPERGQHIPERGQHISERGQHISERGQHISERGQNISERGSNMSERGPGQVTALVNSYQQRYQQQVNRNQWPEKSTDNRNNNTDREGNNVANWSESTSQFYSASEFAYGGGQKSSPPSRPASVSSAAPEQRHLSESSGESELSVASVTTREKKDKKGILGGLFSRKKRPQSHM